jgi:hypothetical protein
MTSADPWITVFPSHRTPKQKLTFIPQFNKYSFSDVPDLLGGKQPNLIPVAASYSQLYLEKSHYKQSGIAR